MNCILIKYLWKTSQWHVLYLNICSHYDQAILFVGPYLTKISMHGNQKKLGQTPWPGAMPSGAAPWEHGPAAAQGPRGLEGACRRCMRRPESSYLDHAWEEGCAVFDLPESPSPWPHVGRCCSDWTADWPGVEPRPSKATWLGPRTGPAPRAWELWTGRWPVASVSGPCGHTCSSFGVVACALCALVDCSDVHEGRSVLQQLCPVWSLRADLTGVDAEGPSGKGQLSVWYCTPDGAQ